MRIGILTFLHNENYGSILQAYALQRVLTELGHEAIHLDYNPSQQEKLRNLLQCGNSPRLILEGMRKRKTIRSHAFSQQKSQALKVFRQEKLRLTAPCHDAAALSQAAREFDALLCGSDQVWSPEWLNLAYFFAFAPETKPRLAYAPSLGVAAMNLRGRKARLMRKQLQKFRAISVREEAGAQILAQLIGKKPPVLPDPVLLLTREAWQDIAVLPKTTQPYLLCYFIGENPAYLETARKLAAEKGLQLLLLPTSAADYAAQDVHVAEEAAPENWLGYFAQADYIVTDSFHGSAFATIMGVPFTPIKRYVDSDSSSKNSRIDQLLNACGMTWAHCDPSAPEVQAKLAELRRTGIDWLEVNLSL